MNFVSCSVDEITSRKYGPHENVVVNLDFVTTFSCDRTKYYPDNDGIPTIVFGLSHGGEITWLYDKDEEAQRDTDYELLIDAVNLGEDNE